MQTLLVPVDFSDATDAVIDAAADMAQSLQARLTLLHVSGLDSFTVGYDVAADLGRDELAHGLKNEHRQLLALEQKLQSRGIAVHAVMKRGDPTREILLEADQIHPRLIVLGSHGHGALYHLLLGGVSTGVLRKANCPVLVVPARAPVPATAIAATAEHGGVVV
jgi:nucleotide-binding universal stress UspA family protein